MAEIETKTGENRGKQDLWRDRIATFRTKKHHDFGNARSDKRNVARWSACSRAHGRAAYRGKRHKELCLRWLFGFQQDIGGGGGCVNVVIWVSGSLAEDVVIRQDQQRRKEAPVVNRNIPLPSYFFY